jgi:hypothetical protein
MPGEADWAARPADAPIKAIVSTPPRTATTSVLADRIRDDLSERGMMSMQNGRVAARMTSGT